MKHEQFSLGAWSSSFINSDFVLGGQFGGGTGLPGVLVFFPPSRGMAYEGVSYKKEFWGVAYGDVPPRACLMVTRLVVVWPMKAGLPRS